MFVKRSFIVEFIRVIVLKGADGIRYLRKVRQTNIYW